MNARPSASSPAGSGAPRRPSFLDIVSALREWKFPERLDGVIAIAHDGIIPGVLVAQRLGVGLKTITIHYRDTFNEPQFPRPQLISSVPGLGDWRRVLLVDDVWLSGKTWETARSHLSRNVEVLPFVLQGDVDFALFREAPGNAHWPWHAD
jgi:uncharacterized protein